MIEDAVEEAQFDAVKPLNSILAQGDGAQLYLLKTIAISDELKLDTFNSVLNRYLSLFQADIKTIGVKYPDMADDLKFYEKMLKNAIVGTDGLFQQHIAYVTLDRRSNLLLTNVATYMSETVDGIDQTISQVRSLSTNANKSAEQTFLQSMTINIVLSAISILIAIIITITTTRALKVPLNIIISALRQLAEGDLTNQIDQKFNSEMGLVTDDINNLNEQLNSLIGEIQKSAVTINNEATQSLAMSVQVNTSARLQKEQSDNIASAVTEMEVAVQEVASHAAHASTSVSTLKDTAQMNMDNMKLNVNFATNLKASLVVASGVIQQLSSESHQIGKILNVIQGISEQTNLLALNAAIEAARAGEQGLGFAVVANEVRTLATRTQKSANEIRTMIGSLQSKATQAVKLVKDNLENSDQSVMQSTQAHTSLSEMLQSLIEVDDVSRSIAAASEEQSAVVREVAENIVNISVMTDDIAKSAEMSAESSKSLSKLSTEQTELISHFKIK